MSFEYYFFLENSNYGPRIAEAYRKFETDNPRDKTPSLSDRARYLSSFCKTVGLDGQAVFFELEEAREKSFKEQQRRSALVSIMVRGGGAAMNPDLREKVSRRIKENGKLD